MTYNVKSATINLADNDQPVITISLNKTSGQPSRQATKKVTVSARRDATSTAVG